MIIDCIADLHGHYPELEGGDLLIVAGDLTARDTEYQHDDFFIWLNNQSYKKKIFIGGNHDNYLQKNNEKFIKTLEKSDLEYLCDSGTEFEGLKIWGSPWSLWFKGISPKCTAFTGDEYDLETKFMLIPHGTDILVTHTPPYGILDSVTHSFKTGSHTFNAGSKMLSLHNRRVRPRLNVFGHIHEGYGKTKIWYSKSTGVELVNASHVDVNYRPVNKPVRIEWNTSQ